MSLALRVTIVIIALNVSRGLADVAAKSIAVSQIMSFLLLLSFPFSARLAHSIAMQILVFQKRMTGFVGRKTFDRCLIAVSSGISG